MMHQRIVADDGDEWCILRTAAPRTLPLAKSLRKAGFKVWTPIETRPVRMKMHDRNRRSPPKPVEREEREAAIMPTFVFARGTDQDIADLAAVLALPISPHPPFSFFRYAGKIPTISGRDMAALRDREEAARNRSRARERHDHAVGSTVKVEDDNFIGLTHEVLSCDGRRAVLAFGGMRMNVRAFKALPVAVQDANERRQDRQRVTGLELVD